jgi:hypothetical protein
MKKAILSLSIIAILTICMLNSVAAGPVNKQTTNVHSNYAVNVRGQQQTYLAAYVGGIGGATAATIGVGGQYDYLVGFLSFGTPPASSWDFSHGMPNATINIQSMNSDGTWSTVATKTTDVPVPLGMFRTTLTPAVAGVYTYRVTYDGDSQYAPAVSNVVTLTVTNVAIS